jgi:hypothetical protein
MCDGTLMNAPDVRDRCRHTSTYASRSASSISPESISRVFGSEREVQAMRRYRPAIIREELDRLLGGGTDREHNIVSELMQLCFRYVAQQALEQEQSDFLGRRHYERAEEHRGHRNG